MSITDELRGFAQEWDWLDYRADESARRLIAIADRIDATHEESIQREHESAYDAGYAEGMGVANKADMRAEYLRGKNDGYDEGWDAAAKTMTERMVELPKDADGEYIRIGDVMENVVCPSVHREVTGVGVECFYGWDEGNGRYSQFDVNRYRHHHAPTVEDVQR